MKIFQHQVATVAILTFCIASTAVARADDRDRGDGDVFVQTNLASGTAPGNATPAPAAAHTDNQLLNAWGVAFFPGGPFWIADNNSGLSTLYDGTGVKQGLVVTIPASPSEGPGAVSAPTGIVWNPDDGHGNEGFQLTNPAGTLAPANFIFDSEDGTISAWNGGPAAKLEVDNSVNPTPAIGAVYKGLALGTNAHGNFLFATNFRAGMVEVYDGKFALATLDGSFTDPDLPAGFAPFGIRNIDGALWVTYAKQTADKHDDVPSPGAGFVDVFDTDGHLLKHFAARGPLDAPWGLAEVPVGFGHFAGDILVGNFGDGRINVYSPKGEFIEQLESADGKPMTIAKLWTLTFGGGLNSSPETLYFTAGPDNEMNGLFGKIEAVMSDRDEDDEDGKPDFTSR
jgi:uncharacterized protein (TIGR03118 family)